MSAQQGLSRQLLINDMCKLLCAAKIHLCLVNRCLVYCAIASRKTSWYAGLGLPKADQAEKFLNS